MVKAAADKLLKAANRPMTMLEQINAAKEKMKAKEEASRASAVGAQNAPEEKKPPAKAGGNMFLN
jgi:hypothetical protein